MQVALTSWGADVFARQTARRVGAKLAIVVPDLSGISRFAVMQDFHYRFIKHLVPGPYVFILEATREVPKLLLTKQKTVGIRVPNHPVTIALVKDSLDTQTLLWIGAAVVIGGGIGAQTAAKIKMTAMPQLVAAFHSLVGLAAVCVAAAAFYAPESFHIAAATGGIKTQSLIERV